MPPSSQRRRTRKQPEADIDKSEREDVDEVETPLRKRRKVSFYRSDHFKTQN